MPLWPQLAVRRGREALAWYVEAFGAEVQYQVGGTDEHESVVAQVAAGDAIWWVVDESPEHGTNSPETTGGTTVRLTLVVGDPAAVQARAVAAGAREIRAVAEEYGWLLGQIEDPYGHRWEIGRPREGWPGYEPSP
jgi:PhnB protein